jgi:hypothetical protein
MSNTIEKSVVYDRDGIQIITRLVDDEYSPELDYLGKYSDQWVEGAIDRAQGEAARTRGEYRYFIPADDRVTSRAWFTKAGYSRHEADCLAREQIQRAYKTMEELNSGDLYTAGLVCEVKIDGRVVGDDSIWGLECSIYSDKNEEYLKDSALDVIRGAIQHAIDMDILKPEIIAKLKRIQQMLQRVSRWQYNASRRADQIARFRSWRIENSTAAENARNRYASVMGCAPRRGVPVIWEPVTTTVYTLRNQAAINLRTLRRDWKAESIWQKRATRFAPDFWSIFNAAVLDAIRHGDKVIEIQWSVQP